VTSVHIERHAERGYVEFPVDDNLAHFDRADRKFVAVAVAHPDGPPILQGTDSKWTEWVNRLAVHRVRISFLCPADVVKFIQRKRRR